jgi:hypothetical protein
LRAGIGWGGRPCPSLIGFKELMSGEWDTDK